MDRGAMGISGGGADLSGRYGLEHMLATAGPHGHDRDDVLPAVEASWSNRNGGEILVTVGSLRLTVSAALARIAHAKLGAALAVPTKAAEMAVTKAAREAVNDGVMKGAELVREALGKAMVNEPITERRAKLCRSVPHRSTRLSAVREAIAVIDNEGAVAAHICGIAFTLDELTEIEATLSLTPFDEDRA